MPALPRALFHCGAHPLRAARRLQPAPLSSTQTQGFPEGRFHNELRVRVRKGFLVHCHVGYGFAQQQPPLSNHPLAPWTFHSSNAVVQPSAPPPTMAKPSAQALHHFSCSSLILSSLSAHLSSRAAQKYKADIFKAVEVDIFKAVCRNWMPFFFFFFFFFFCWH